MVTLRVLQAPQRSSALHETRLSPSLLSSHGSDPPTFSSIPQLAHGATWVKRLNGTNGLEKSTDKVTLPSFGWLPPYVPSSAPPYVPLYVPPYLPLHMFLCMPHVPLCVFLPSNLFRNLSMSLCVSVSVCVFCVPLPVPPVYPCELELQMWFSDLIHRSVCCSLAREGPGGKRGSSNCRWTVLT